MLSYLPYSRDYLLCLLLITYIFLDTSMEPTGTLYCLLHSLPHLWILPSRTVVTSDSKMFIGGLNWDTTDGIHFTQWQLTFVC